MPESKARPLIVRFAMGDFIHYDQTNSYPGR